LFFDFISRQKLGRKCKNTYLVGTKKAGKIPAFPELLLNYTLDLCNKSQDLEINIV
jgi:hypothetical protein